MVTLVVSIGLAILISAFCSMSEAALYSLPWSWIERLRKEKAEREEAEALKRRVGDSRCVNFAGRQQLEELPALYAIAEVMLTNDSGPGHFSAVTKLRTFVIFGPETPHLYGSLGNSTPIYAGLACSPCVSAANHRKTPCTDNVCLQVIQPETVLEQVRGALKESRSA